MGQIKKWATDTLSADAAYTALCVSTVGSALNFYRSSPIDRVVEALPFFTAYSNEANQDFGGQVEHRRTWEIPFAIGIEANEASEADGDATVWTSTDKAEILAVNAIETLRLQARSCGILGEDVIILNTRVIVSEIGEADDVQANVFVTFGEMYHI
jgi:hypothetical protein